MRENKVRKIIFMGRTWYFYEENVTNDYLPLIKCGSLYVTTKDAKRHLENIIFITSTIIDAGSIFDDRLDKYSKALDVFNACRAIFSRKPLNMTAEMAKIAIEVIQEIALLEEKDPQWKMGIKSAAFAAKLLIDGVINDG